MGGSGRKTRIKFLAAIAIGAAALLAATPFLASWPPMRDWVVTASLPMLNGSVRSGDGAWGWLRPVRLEQVEVLAVDGSRAMFLPEVRGDLPLWRMAAQLTSFGSFRAEHARIEVIVGPSGVNLENLFKPVIYDVNVGFELVDAAVSLRSIDSARDWQLAPLNVRLALQSSSVSPSRRVELVLQPGVVFRDAVITAEMCRAILPHLLPATSAGASAAGAFTLEIGEWRFPLETPQQAAGSGRLTFHRLQVSSAAFDPRLAALLGLPAELSASPESTVEFELRDGRLHHRKFTLGGGRFRLTTHGSVGLDESLDIIVEASIVDPAAPEAAGAGIPIAIGGTLRKPEFGAKALKDTGRELMRNVLGGLLEKRRPQPPANAPQQPPPQRDLPSPDSSH